MEVPAAKGQLEHLHMLLAYTTSGFSTGGLPPKSGSQSSFDRDFKLCKQRTRLFLQEMEFSSIIAIIYCLYMIVGGLVFLFWCNKFGLQLHNKEKKRQLMIVRKLHHTPVENQWFTQQ